VQFRLSLLIVAFGLSASGAETVPSFATSLYPALKAAGCPMCHNPDGVASGTRLHFPDANASAADIETFGNSLGILVDRANPSQSLLFRKPTNRIPHAGGQRIKPGSPEETALIAWIDHLAKSTPQTSGEAPATAMKPPFVEFRRLTHSQYNNTARDLLGDRSLPANGFPPEDFVNGFKGQYESQSISPILMDAYGTAAEKLANAAFRSGVPASLLACKPSLRCRGEFIRSFGLRAFRRPLKPAEAARYEALFAKQASFTAGARIVVEAMLQSPNFLFHLEDTKNPAWKPYAAASQLSYALWDTMPDAALFEAAAKGELNTPAEIEVQARRMLKDPRAKQAVDEFAAEWLRFDRALTATKDRSVFREFTPDTLYAMTEEARAFIADLVWNDGNFMDLFSAPYGYMNADLAKLYGAPAPETEYQKTAFPAGSERAGILGQGLFLALTAKPEETSPTARGLFVREQFLCQHVPDPPPGVNTNLPPVSEDRPKTNRERMAEHTTNPTCATCHSLIDPIGFGFEKFDAIGARREKLKIVFRGEGESRKVRKTVQVDLDTTGKVAGIPDSNFSSPKELGAILARSAVCQECMVKQYFRYVAGRLETPGDRPLLARVFADFSASGFRFRDLIIAMAVNREFPGSAWPGQGPALPISKSEREANVASNH
jgi:hypothetical protein